jgi:arylformamidase
MGQNSWMIEYRASFDADVTFANGGGLQVQGFRLDIPGQSISDDELAALFVRHLGLLMVDQVELRGVRVIEEPHKGSRGGPAAGPVGAPSRLVELNHVIEAGMTTYPGLPGPEISPYLSREASRSNYAPGTEFTIDWIKILSNTGTYVDSPFHRYEGGVDLAGMPLSSFADLPIVVARVAGAAERGIGPLTLAPLDVGGAAVLLHTGWDRHFRTEAYGAGAPFLTREGAEYLVSAGARLVGIDSLNIDDTESGRRHADRATGEGERPCHSILLAAGIPILEHLTGLEQLPISGARLHAAPLRIRDFGTVAVRAYAIVP